MKILIHCQTSAVKLLMFGKEKVVSAHTLLDVWLLIHVRVKVNPYQWKGPLLVTKWLLRITAAEPPQLSQITGNLVLLDLLSTTLHPHENSLGELTECSENREWYYHKTQQNAIAWWVHGNVYHIKSPLLSGIHFTMIFSHSSIAFLF